MSVTARPPRRVRQIATDTGLKGLAICSNGGVLYDIGAKTTFFGHVPEAGSRCGEFDVLAVPSSRESFGLAALEAMACGTPIVATRVGGLPELILDGETGMLVPPEDERAMADALLAILRDRDLAARLGGAGRSRAVSVFSEKKMQAAWIALSSPR